MTLFEDLRFENMNEDRPNTSDTAGDAGESSDGLGSMLEADLAFTLVTGFLRTQPLEPALGRILAYKDTLSALEAELLAGHQHRTGASDRETERLASQGGKRSKRAAKKHARRSKTVGANPELGKDLADGELSTEQVDAIADAAASTGGDAANDNDLISDIKDSDADQARRLAKQYVDDHGGPTEQESRYNRRRRLRKVSRFTTEDGADAILAQGDHASIEEMWATLTKTSKDLYRKDGGRDLPNHKHPRNRAQRLYDALHQTLTHTPTPDGSPRSDRSGGSRSGRPTIVVTASVKDLYGDNNSLGETALANLVGTGPLPTNVFNRYWCNANIVGIIFGGNGQPLWQSRNTRTVTPAQLTALIARDHHCVKCGAHHRECEAHHLTPWNAPAKGETNIETLALLCTDCHHHIHHHNQTLYQHPQTRRWHTRPATPNETPPPKPHTQQPPHRNHPQQE